MAYPSSFEPSLRKVAATRQQRLNQKIPFLTPDQKMKLLETFHPDFRPQAAREIRVGASKGGRAPNELVDLLESRSRVDPARVDLSHIDYDVDVLVIGAGGAGATAALFAHYGGARVLLATKLRHGDSNTIMAEGGIAAATRPDDSPTVHFVDTMRGGRYSNVPELVEALVHDAPLIIDWLFQLGVGFGRAQDGHFMCHGSAGHSRLRSHAWSDMTGLEVMRVLRDEIQNRDIQVLEFHPTVELLTDGEGRCTGAILYSLDTGRYLVVRARSTILATGGIGRLHIQGFATSNHYGATGDGLVLAYRVGCKLANMDAIQYHPTGTVWPDQLFGLLVSESTRANGNQLVNAEGERYINELETRDTVASANIRECQEGRGIETPAGTVGVWLDAPVLDMIWGKGWYEKRFPHIFQRFYKYGIDSRELPILIYPTQHYQNGGVLSQADSGSGVPGLFLAGEVAGGVHGRNRLGSNSLVDIFVFGRRSGINAAALSRESRPGRLTLEHLNGYHRELAEAGLDRGMPSPAILPDYVAGARSATAVEG